MAKPVGIEQWAGTYLIERQIAWDTDEIGDRTDLKECERAVGRRDLAWERLITDPSESYADLSAKVSIAVDQLRVDASERALEMLGSVLADLRLMEAQASLADKPSEPAPS